MTLKKVKLGTFESHPFFHLQEAKVNDKVKIVEKPRMVEVKKFNSNDTEEKLFVDVKITEKPDYAEFDDSEARDKDDVRVWSMNNSSRNEAIELLGENEDKWKGETLPVEVLSQVISGKKKKIVYVRGAVKEEED